MRRLLLLLLIPLLLLALLWSGFWWWSADRLEEQVATWQADQAELGRRAAFSKLTITGYPLRLRLRLDDPRLQDAGGWLWQGPTVTGSASFWQPHRIALSFPGTQRLEPPPGSPLAPLELAAGHAAGLVLLDRSGHVAGWSLDLARIALAGYVDGGMTAESLSLAWGAEPVSGLSLPEEPAPQQREDRLSRPFRFLVEGLTAPSAVQPPLGRTLERLETAGRLEGRPPLGAPADALPAWAAQGGALDLQSLEVIWGPLTLQGAATVTLDRQNRPLGAGNARIIGFEQTLQAFADGGLVEDSVARTVRLALLALSREGDDGRRSIQVPLTAQDGVLLVGPLPLLPLEPLF